MRNRSSNTIPENDLTAHLSANVLLVGAALVETLVPATAELLIASPFTFESIRSDIFAVEFLRICAAFTAEDRLEAAWRTRPRVASRSAVVRIRIGPAS